MEEIVLPTRWNFNIQQTVKSSLLSVDVHLKPLEDISEEDQNGALHLPVYDLHSRDPSSPFKSSRIEPSKTSSGIEVTNKIKDDKMVAESWNNTRVSFWKPFHEKAKENKYLTEFYYPKTAPLFASIMIVAFGDMAASFNNAQSTLSLVNSKKTLYNSLLGLVSAVGLLSIVTAVIPRLRFLMDFEMVLLGSCSLIVLRFAQMVDSSNIEGRPVSVYISFAAFTMIAAGASVRFPFSLCGTIYYIVLYILFNLAFTWQQVFVVTVPVLCAGLLALIVSINNELTGRNTYRRQQILAEEIDEARKATDKVLELLRYNLPDSIVTELHENHGDFNQVTKTMPSTTACFFEILNLDYTNSEDNLANTDLNKFLAGIAHDITLFNTVLEQVCDIVKSKGGEFIKSIGSSKALIVCGMQISQGLEIVDHVNQCIYIAGSIIKYLQSTKFGGKKLKARCGIQTGPTTTAIVGMNKFAYDIYGDTVNTSSRMMSKASDGELYFTAEVYDKIFDRHAAKSVGEFDIKGKGVVHVYSFDFRLFLALESHMQSKRASKLSYGNLRAKAIRRVSIQVSRDNFRHGTSVNVKTTIASSKEDVTDSFNSSELRAIIEAQVYSDGRKSQVRDNPGSEWNIKDKTIDQGKRNRLAELMSKLHDIAVQRSPFYIMLNRITLQFRNSRLEKEFRNYQFRRIMTGGDNIVVLLWATFVVCCLCLFAGIFSTANSVTSLTLDAPNTIAVTACSMFIVTLLFISCLILRSYVYSRLKRLTCSDDELHAQTSFNIVTWRLTWMCLVLSFEIIAVIVSLTSVLLFGLEDVTFGPAITCVLIFCIGMTPGIPYNLAVMPTIATPILATIAIQKRSKPDPNASIISYTVFYVFSCLAIIVVLYRQELWRKEAFLSEKGQNHARAICQSELEKSNLFLINTFNRRVSATLRENPQAGLMHYTRNGAVLALDITGFTAFSSKMTSIDLVQMLNKIYLEFDLICQEQKLEKICTIGDAYIAVGGLPEPVEYPSLSACTTALKMQSTIASFKPQIEVSSQAPEKVNVRIGVHSGPICCALIGGRIKIRYDIVGDAIDLATELEQTAIPGTVHICRGTLKALMGHECRVTEMTILRNSRSYLLHKLDGYENSLHIVD
ncbi:hypothetical protein HDU76_009009 [Blyttiomyces sp. JEL0837]|nr:hypothetical protein HDU76_009009 [Blyttiomyces sp. JEL0837]